MRNAASRRIMTEKRGGLRRKRKNDKGMEAKQTGEVRINETIMKNGKREELAKKKKKEENK